MSGVVDCQGDGEGLGGAYRTGMPKFGCVGFLWGAFLSAGLRGAQIAEGAVGRRRYPDDGERLIVNGETRKGSRQTMLANGSVGGNVLLRD